MNNVLFGLLMGWLAFHPVGKKVSNAVAVYINENAANLMKQNEPKEKKEIER